MMMFQYLFAFMPNATKLHSSDAQFVDVIHSYTNISRGHYGYIRVGKVDFHLNSGHHQPGCAGSRSSKEIS